MLEGQRHQKELENAPFPLPESPFDGHQKLYPTFVPRISSHHGTFHVVSEYLAKIISTLQARARYGNPQADPNVVEIECRGTAYLSAVCQRYGQCLVLTVVYRGGEHKIQGTPQARGTVHRRPHTKPSCPSRAWSILNRICSLRGPHCSAEREGLAV